MTVSAAVRFRPVPPALRRDQEDVGACRCWNVSIGFCAVGGGAGQRRRSGCRAACSPSRDQRRACAANCEKTSTRRPCAELLVEQLHQHVVLRRLAHAARAASPRTRRGSQQTWRSFISASRIVMVEPPRPLLRDAPGAPRRAPRRGCSRRARAARRRSSTGRTISVLGGSSRATSSLVRRRMYGATCSRSARRRSRSPVALDRHARTGARNQSASPSSPGLRKSNSDHSSPRWFSTGVPDRQRRWRGVDARARRGGPGCAGS